jgi:hypothetical protein
MNETARFIIEFLRGNTLSQEHNHKPEIAGTLDRSSPTAW